jgi:hypothetical protein
MGKSKIKNLSEALLALTNKGFVEDFKAYENCITALYSHKEYQPEDLLILESFRFAQNSKEEDDVQLLGIVSKDGKKGTLVISYGNEHSQNVELVKSIEELKNY